MRAIREAFLGFTADDLEQVLVLGGTARGSARPDSDADLFCVTKDGRQLQNPERIIKLLEPKIPGVVIQIGGGSREQAAHFVSRKNKRGEPPAWECVWKSRGAQSLDDLILSSVDKD